MKKDNTLDTEFVDINKESKYKDYIIVGILYVAVIILSIFLILGIKNQKDIVKNNIKEEKVTNTVEDNLENFEQNIENNTETNSNKESLFEEITSVTEETSEQIEEDNDTYTNILNQLD